jgi:MoaA/NifB/PqqE/SkfB family radical SAM enzyme
MDRSRRKIVYWQTSWLPERLDEILDYLISRGGQSVAYAGVGELFMDPGAFALIERVRAKGLGFVIFTNGQTLIDRQLVDRLDKLSVTVILSFRDTDETEHDRRTHLSFSFRRTITALSHCLKGRFRRDRRLAVEMPVTRLNRDRAADLLIVARALGVTPLIESYVVIGRTDEEIKEALTFRQTDDFFQKISGIDRSLGYDNRTEWGQRIVARPPCRRPLFTFTVSEDMKIVGCPADAKVLGSIDNQSIQMAVETRAAKEHILNSDLCPCSTFVGIDLNNIPKWLPLELVKLTKDFFAPESIRDC